MNIALVAPPWLPVPPRSYGGTELVIDALARGLRAAGHEVVLVAHKASTCPVPRHHVLDFDDDIAIGNVLVELRHSTAAYELLGDVDLVHDHTLAGPLLAPRRSVPIVTTVHGTFDDWNVPVYARIAERARLVGISRSQVAHARNVPIERVIHHGLDLGAYPAGPGGGPLLFLGRIAPEKGPHRAIALARAAGRPLLIAAKMREQGERDFFEARVKPLLGAGIEYVGEPTVAAKVALLGTATALLNPIRWPEPFGLVMIESLACGTPVITYDEGAASEIVTHGETGFVCSGDTEVLDALAHVDEIDRAACRTRCAQHFSMERMTADHLALYDSVCRAAGAERVLADRLLTRPVVGLSRPPRRVPLDVDPGRKAAHGRRIPFDVDVDMRAGECDPAQAQELDVGRQSRIQPYDTLRDVGVEAEQRPQV
jgi:glycosyltransferase involved in cell wall biosynthesis